MSEQTLFAHGLWWLFMACGEKIHLRHGQPFDAHIRFRGDRRRWIGLSFQFILFDNGRRFLRCQDRIRSDQLRNHVARAHWKIDLHPFPIWFGLLRLTWHFIGGNDCVSLKWRGENSNGCLLISDRRKQRREDRSLLDHGCRLIVSNRLADISSHWYQSRARTPAHSSWMMLPKYCIYLESMWKSSSRSIRPDWSELIWYSSSPAMKENSSPHLTTPVWNRFGDQFRTRTSRMESNDCIYETKRMNR